MHHNLNQNLLYIFFEDHQREGFFNSLFANHVRKYSKKVKKKRNAKHQIVNHLGCLFYHQNEWLVAELDYFNGGKIVRSFSKSDLRTFQIFENGKISDEQKLRILEICNDGIFKKSWFYSLRRYEFQECIGYVFCRKRKIGLILVNLLQNLLNLFGFLTPRNHGYNCVKLTFRILTDCKRNPFKQKASPYELLCELDNT